MGKGLAIVLGGVLALAALAPAASAQEQPPEQEIGLLFAQTANRGTMKPIEGPTPRFNLKLRGVNSQVVWFQDRPGRQSGDIPVPEFTRSWAGFGFVEDPPNAALTLLHAGNGQDTMVMELGRPHFKKKKNRVRYSAQLLDQATGNLSYLNSDLDPRVNRRFRSPSLFIDDATAKVVNGCVIQPYTKCLQANLSHATLYQANLTWAHLDGANLSNANLIRANLSNAKLVQANLTEAGLVEANLTGARAADVNLSKADLTLANLTGAVLYQANLYQADLDRTNLTDANLSRALNSTPRQLSRARLCRTTMPDGKINNSNCPK